MHRNTTLVKRPIGAGETESSVIRRRTPATGLHITLMVQELDQDFQCASKPIGVARSALRPAAFADMKLEMTQCFLSAPAQWIFVCANNAALLNSGLIATTIP